MPQKRFNILGFDKGIIRRMDSADIPDNAAYDSVNIDGDAPMGILKAIPTASTKTMGSTTATQGKIFEWIKTKDSKWNLVYADVGYANVVTDFYGTTPASYFSATAIASTATSMLAHNEQVRIANGVDTGIPTAPKWIGYCDYGHFGGSTKAWQYGDASLARPIYTTDYTINAAPRTGTTPFDAKKIYYYNISFIIDGVQETPIGSSYSSWSISSYGDDADCATITVTIKNYASLNSRITGVKLYRKEHDFADNPLTLWRLQKTFDVTASVAYVDRTGANISWFRSTGGVPDVAGTEQSVLYVDNNEDILSSYEEQSGIPETLTTSDVYYSLNCDLNSYHFVGLCYKSGLPDAPMMLFRSKQYRYDTFDWTNDYLKLPTMPTAIKAFNGKIWVFDENNIYRINPDGMYIEDSTTGIGCLSQRSVVVTDYGMFWCDYNNAYMHDGEQIIPIGEPIKTTPTSTYDWSGFNKDYTVGLQGLTPIVVFHSPKNYVMFIIPDYASSNGVSNVWAYHVINKRWDKWESFTYCGASSVGFGAFSGRIGEVYVANSSTIEEPLGDTGYRAFTWTSKVIDFDNPSLYKVFYRPLMDNTSLTSSPVVTYGKDRATPTSSLTTNEFISGGNYEEGKLLQLKINESTGYGNSVYSLSVIYRELFEL